MEETKQRELASQQFIRQELFQNKQSEVRKYQELITGERGFGALCKYEAIVTLVGSIPGALGLFLRRYFFRYLFKEVGKGLILGRNVVVRHGDKIRLGTKVVIDDYGFVDARGAGDEGLSIGDGVLIGRGATIQSKFGPITIGEHTSIGSHSVVCAMGEIIIGQSVLIAGGCSISGGMYHTEGTDLPIVEQGIYTRGPVSIGDGSWLGMGVIVLDGVTIGKGCVIAAGAVVTRDLPDYAVAAGVPAKVKRLRVSSTSGIAMKRGI